jgi:aspartate racemase
MKTPGIIGGTGPESTIDYYRSIIALYRERTNDDSYPLILIQSIDLKRLRDDVTANRLSELMAYLLENIQKLAQGGADFGLLSANTPHLVFDDLAHQSPIPLISIVEVTCDAAKKQGLKRLGLIGTRFTMQARFYPDAFQRAGLKIVIPEEDEQTLIHNIYLNELLHNQFRPESREGILSIVQRMKQDEQIDGLILGGTELPLLLRGAEVSGVPFLDTTQIHVERIVDEILA